MAQVVAPRSPMPSVRSSLVVPPPVHAVPPATTKMGDKATAARAAAAPPTPSSVRQTAPATTAAAAGARGAGGQLVVGGTAAQHAPCYPWGVAPPTTGASAGPAPPGQGQQRRGGSATLPTTTNVFNGHGTARYSSPVKVQGPHGPQSSQGPGAGPSTNIPQAWLQLSPGGPSREPPRSTLQMGATAHSEIPPKGPSSTLKWEDVVAHAQKALASINVQSTPLQLPPPTSAEAACVPSQDAAPPAAPKPAGPVKRFERSITESTASFAVPSQSFAVSTASFAVGATPPVTTLPSFAEDIQKLSNTGSFVSQARPGRVASTGSFVSGSVHQGHQSGSFVANSVIAGRTPEPHDSFANSSVLVGREPKALSQFAHRSRIDENQEWGQPGRIDSGGKMSVALDPRIQAMNMAAGAPPPPALTEAAGQEEANWDDVVQYVRGVGGSALRMAGCDQETVRQFGLV